MTEFRFSILYDRLILRDCFYFRISQTRACADRAESSGPLLILVLLKLLHTSALMGYTIALSEILRLHAGCSLVVRVCWSVVVDATAGLRLTCDQRRPPDHSKTVNSTRRFCWRPSTVLLLAIGFCCHPVAVMRKGYTLHRQILFHRLGNDPFNLSFKAAGL